MASPVSRRKKKKKKKKKPSAEKKKNAILPLKLNISAGHTEW